VGCRESETAPSWRLCVARSRLYVRCMSKNGSDALIVLRHGSEEVVRRERGLKMDAVLAEAPVRFAHLADCKADKTKPLSMTTARAQQQGAFSFSTINFSFYDGILPLPCSWTSFAHLWLSTDDELRWNVTMTYVDGAFHTRLWHNPCRTPRRCSYQFDIFSIFIE
jgi:hypothetical protein